MGACHGKERTYREYYQRFLSNNIPIVSIEQAVEPLRSFLPRIDVYVRLAKDRCQTPADNLTVDQSTSIMLYSMAWQPFDQCLYVVLNRILDEFNYDKLQSWILYLKLLLTAVLRLPSISLNVYRTCSTDVNRLYMINERFSWWDISLCRTSNENIQSIFHIQCQTGKDIRNHTYISDENLIVILPGTEFRVIESTNERIQLEEVRSSFLLHDRHYSAYRNIYLEQLILTNNRSWIVDLDEQNLTDHDMKTVVKYAMIKTRCKRIRLRTNNITAEGIRILARGVHHNMLLESLDLRNNSLGDLGVEYLALAIVHSNLKTLNLESNSITSKGAIYLAEILKNNRKLTEVYLSKNHLGDIGIEYLTNILRDAKNIHSEHEHPSMTSSTLQHLYLGHNNITDLGVEYLSEMLKTNRILTWLWLCGNEIGNHGVELLANILANQNLTLEWLFLNSNPSIDDQCIDSLINMLKRNHTLKTIYINNCQLTDDGKQKLRDITKLKKDFDLEV